MGPDFTIAAPQVHTCPSNTYHHSQVSLHINSLQFRLIHVFPLPRNSGLLKPGEMCLVLGCPGSGCTTFLKAIANERASYAAVRGDVRYAGINHEEMKKHYKGEVAYNQEGSASSFSGFQTFADKPSPQMTTTLPHLLSLKPLISPWLRRLPVPEGAFQALGAGHSLMKSETFFFACSTFPTPTKRSSATRSSEESAVVSENESPSQR